MAKKTTTKIDDFKRGVEAAAGVLELGGFNAVTTHPFRLGDVILCKLNQTARKKPRRNKVRLEDPKDALVRGFAMGLAGMHAQLILAGHDEGLCRLAREMRLTLAEAKRVGVMEIDLARLRAAGVK
jgi:hypothetical protein